MTVRQMFDSQLHELHKNLLSMGMLVDAAIYKAVKSLVDKDAALAQEVVEGDQTINEMELEIERRSFELIALQQPVGSDLRRIVTTIKVATDLERMADHAVSIAKVAIRLHNDAYAKPLIDIPEMGELVKDMVHKALNAYIDIDLEAAKSIAARDDQLDHHFYAIYGDLVNLMIQDSRHIEQATYLIFVAQYLERIGDYVTNICEWIIYLKTGKLVELN
ncbi:phosphate signaling complex protein PhoU [Bacillus chungangensis]|uniref:Phosphate-specific transport system accessory protein PhoU n=1 Tax=Bacillus chungangensis TaxID=587633 RepID=A0ABT9WW02_9BACI|nr:phosphate signaling complex protein PhoU [Bacillus chungangensis]MDQ0177047.1 phosphate transport system protein [Bacillus chungangensis]